MGIEADNPGNWYPGTRLSKSTGNDDDFVKNARK